MTIEVVGLEARSPSNLSELLDSLTVERFFSEFWNQRFFQLTGTTNRFSELCSWEQVNSILDGHTLHPPQIKLTKNGITVPAPQYLDLRDRDFPTTNTNQLLKQLEYGAMLELNCIERTSTALRGLTNSLRVEFNASTFATIVANFRTRKGLNVHWNHYEVFVFQIEGRKHWKVYKPTTLSAYKPYEEAGTELPTEEPIFDAVIEPGALLYIPKGWRYAAYALNDPSLHISIGVKVPTGIDFLKWFAEKMKESEICRRDIPHESQVKDKAECLQNIFREISKSWSEGILDRFLEEYNDDSVPQPSTHLPKLIS